MRPDENSIRNCKTFLVLYERKCVEIWRALYSTSRARVIRPTSKIIEVKKCTNSFCIVLPRTTISNANNANPHTPPSTPIPKNIKRRLQRLLSKNLLSRRLFLNLKKPWQLLKILPHGNILVSTAIRWGHLHAHKPVSSGNRRSTDGKTPETEQFPRAASPRPASRGLRGAFSGRADTCVSRWHRKKVPRQTFTTRCASTAFPLPHTTTSRTSSKIATALKFRNTTLVPRVRNTDNLKYRGKN